ncbi:MAG: hypothetical protein HJJLKODD_00413 [Phycisphaerae bacterium]|nr:hypothetical protein [Phycisphaerae bacterium]
MLSWLHNQVQRVPSSANRSLIALGLLLVCGCNTVTPSLAIDNATSGASCQKAADETSLINTVLVEVNRERQERGLNSLSLDESLSVFAGDYACIMIEQDFFGHENPTTGQTFNDRLCNSTFRGYVAGENIAKGYVNPVQLVSDWMNSESHRANILSDEFVAMGLGIRISGTGQAFWVQHFVGEPPEYPELAFGCDEVEEAPAESSSSGLLGSLNDSPTLPMSLLPLPDELTREVTPTADDRSAAE